MSRPSSRINPDSVPVLVFALAVTGVLTLVSFALSFAGLVAVAEWAAVPTWLRWAVPVTIDGAILVYTVAVFVFRARREPQALSWTALSLWTAVSVAANGAHAWDAGEGDWRAVAGAVIAGLAPVAVLLATHTIADLIIARPEAEPVIEPEPVPLTASWVADPIPPTGRVEFDAVEPRPEPAVSSLVVAPAPTVRASVPSRRRATEDDGGTKAEALRLRTEEALTVRQIAERLGVSPSAAGRYVEGVPPSRLAEPIPA